MFHEPTEQFFYSSCKINVELSDGISPNTIKKTATGFLLEIGKGMAWIATNRHVVDPDYRQPTAKYKNFGISKFLITGRRPDDSQYTYELHEAAKAYFHNDTENDVALIEARILLNGGEKWSWHFGVEHLADKKIYQAINPFDLICYTSFPQQYDKVGNRPLIRSGHIASDPKHNYSWDNSYKGQCVAYEGFSSGGSSGSPIFAPPRGLKSIPNSRNGYLIGINAGHIPNGVQHSGISYFYKSTVLLEIIKQNQLQDINFDNWKAR